MNDFLSEMAQHSAKRAAAIDATALRKALSTAPPTVPLRLDRFDLIAEIKRASPSVGAFTDLDADPEAALAEVRAQAEAYVRGGAAALSVLTEPSRFKGDLDHLRAIVAQVAGRRPVMRKDFLVDPVQIVEARVAGASGVLLITRMLGDGQILELLDMASALGLFVLLEAFDEADLRRAEGLAVTPSPEHPGVLLGLNSRDLVSLQVDFERLLGDLPWPEGLRVAESGIDGPDHAARCAAAGYRLGLVGSALMRSGDPQATTEALLAAGRGAARA